jgi:hypothetical protein
MCVLNASCLSICAVDFLVFPVDREFRYFGGKDKSLTTSENGKDKISLPLSALWIRITEMVR